VSFTAEQTVLLSAPLNKANVATRQQAGQTLSYLTAWHVIAEANRIFGFGQWDRETVEMRQLGEPRLVDG
jgi:DNA repair and recombination protein RAD52